MRRWIAASVLVLACGEAAAPAPSGAPEPSSAAASSAAAPTSASTAPSSPAAPAPPADPADCERVRPCADAFAAVAPADLAGPARVAVEQLDQSLTESPARAAACTAALASFRADLERLELDVPEACRASVPSAVAR